MIYGVCNNNNVFCFNSGSPQRETPSEHESINLHESYDEALDQSPAPDISRSTLDDLEAAIHESRENMAR